jgi:hypothetical protein
VQSSLVDHPANEMSATVVNTGNLESVKGRHESWSESSFDDDFVASGGHHDPFGSECAPIQCFDEVVGPQAGILDSFSVRAAGHVVLRVDCKGPGPQVGSPHVGFIGQPDGQNGLLSSPREGEF